MLEFVAKTMRHTFEEQKHDYIKLCIMLFDFQRKVICQRKQDAKQSYPISVPKSCTYRNLNLAVK